MIVAAFRKLVVRAAWAPIAVLVLHAVVAKTSLRNPFDFPIHFLGGASMAYVAYHALDCFKTWFGAITWLTRYLFSFCFACTVGVFWEIGERSLDYFLRMRIQQTLENTMLDLIADATGAAAALLLVAVVGAIRRTGRSESGAPS
jgi:hypothetical protein